MRVIWAVLCERSITDKDTNNLSLINIVEEMTVTPQPPQTVSEQGVEESTETAIAIGNFELVVLWVRSDVDVPERGYGRIRIISPDTTEAASHEGNEVDLTQYLRLRSRTRFANFPMRGPGVYLIKIDGRATTSSEWTEKFELPLRMLLHAQDSS